MTSVLNQCGGIGYQLLFPTTPWVYDAAGVITNLPAKYQYKADPPPVALNANVATRDARNSQVNIVEREEQKLVNLFTDLRTIISRLEVFEKQVWARIWCGARC